MKKYASFALAGLILGVLIAEYKPDLFGDAFGGLKAAFAGPFSHYRNNLALNYGIAGAALGAVIGFLSEQMGK